MNAKFRAHVESLEDKFRYLIRCQPVERSTISEKGGVYLFSDGAKHLYVGRAKNLRRRIHGHSTPSSKDAPFAFRLARERTNRRRATYRTEGSRKELLRDPEFAAAFSDAKERIRNMSARFVIEENAINQALLEIYVALALDTPYNDFETH